MFESITSSVTSGVASAYNGAKSTVGGYVEYVVSPLHVFKY